MIDLNGIQKMWEEDSKIDPDNLHTESLNIPVLHAKYFDLYNNIFLLMKKAQQQRKILGMRDMNIIQAKQIQRFI